MLSRVFLPLMNIVRRTSHNARSITTYSNDAEEQMTITNNGDVIVCWHPERSFPYDCSKPLPSPDPPSDSMYKMETTEEVYKVFKEQHPEFMREELAKLTFTTKHRWYPNTTYKRRKKTPPNRPYL